MRKSSSQNKPELYQYKYLPLALQGTGDRAFKTPSQEQVNGDIRIGEIIGTNIIYCLRPVEVVRHFLAVGSSGSGKTNLMRLLMIELNRLGIPFMCFDLVKCSARYILDYIPNLIILRWDKDFFFNALRPPPGVIFKVWRMLLCEITSEIFGILTASNLYLNKLVQDVYDKFAIDRPDEFPTMLDLNDEIEERKKKKIPRNEIGYLNVISNKIDPLCDALIECVNAQEGIPIEELLEHPVCIELVGIKSSNIQMWIVSCILAWIIAYRETQPMAFGNLKHVFFFDEADRILGKGD